MWLHTMELMTMTSCLTKPHELYQILCLKQERILWVWNTIVLLFFSPLKICLNHFKAISMAQLSQIRICDLFPDRVCNTCLCAQTPDICIILEVRRLLLEIFICQLYIFIFKLHRLVINNLYNFFQHFIHHFKHINSFTILK